MYGGGGVAMSADILSLNLFKTFPSHAQVPGQYKPAWKLQVMSHGPHKFKDIENRLFVFYKQINLKKKL